MTERLPVLGAHRASAADEPPHENASSSMELEPVPGFSLKSDGLYLEDGDRDIYVCGPIAVAALARTTENGAWGKDTHWQDRDGNVHRRVVPVSHLLRFGLDVCSMLVDEGLHIAPDGQALRSLLTYLNRAEPKQRLLLAQRTGWIQTPSSLWYVTGGRVVGVGVDQVAPTPELQVSGKQSEAGTLTQWRDSIGTWCVGNSRLLVATSMAFAAKLLYFSGLENGGINFQGGSGIGKTTLLRVAASVDGGADSLQNWRMTDNAMEAIAAQHNDKVLPLDELGQVDPRKVGEMMYSLGNGVGKGRANRSGGARARQAWRTLALSTAEVPFAQHASLAGVTLRAGQEVRFTDVSADAGKELGVFEDLHGHADGAAFSEALRTAARQFHGVVGAEFAQLCASDAEGLRAMLAGSMLSFTQRCKAQAGAALEGQATRVADRFALIAAAGELASRWGLTGWPANAASDAATRMFLEWLDARGTPKNVEAHQILDALRHFLIKFGESRFSEADRAESEHQRTISNRAGWTYTHIEDGTREYWITPTVFRQEIFAGFSISTVCQVLNAAGCMTTTTEHGKKRYDIKRGIGRSMRPRFYVIDSRLFDIDEAG